MTEFRIRIQKTPESGSNLDPDVDPKHFNAVRVYVVRDTAGAGTTQSLVSIVKWIHLNVFVWYPKVMLSYFVYFSLLCCFNLKNVSRNYCLFIIV